MQSSAANRTSCFCPLSSAVRGSGTSSAPSSATGPIPEHWEPATFYEPEQKVLDIWDYLHALDRPEVHYVEAGWDEEQVYSAVAEYIADRSPAKN